ncbi:polysaccharide biosynthesis protein [Stanieria cyanosphaera PCC 7437]|uniref:Polysaccharide biosynthesis protein n=1 Tax=Stanieria cyanosphaera (strain ATCC 29371 / PCC 7437) TaxID=111780 RepID=K9XYK5_STAC7|nr:oligosaccharide flippase family protein [Stanieria cyanosphaera]AFZ37211.1 polysaccharide biosynthesis protein [Stanieria cyanosphaera PCC 7437]
MQFKIRKSQISKLFKANLFRDTLWILLAKLFNVVMQAIYFVIVARFLGAENYGSFIAVTALASIVFPFVALGSEHLLVQYTAINRSNFPIYWGNTLLLLLINSSLLTIGLLILSPIIFPENISWLTILIILLADLFCLGLLDISSKAFISTNFVKKFAQLGILSTCGKLLAALSLAIFFPHPNTLTWACLYLISSAVIALIGILSVNHIIGSAQFNISKLKSEIKTGIYFSISSSANNINSSLDKTMLGSMATLTSTGIYGSAYRFIDVGYVPLFAIFGAAYTKFFQHGSSGIRSSLGFAKKLFPFVVGYGILSVIGYLVFAPVLPIILGNEYADAIAALRWLAPIPCLAAFQMLAADTLTGAGFQKSRSIVQVVAALLNLGLNFILIPQFSWKGAAWATLCSDSFRMVGLWIIVIVLYRQEVKMAKSS